MAMVARVSISREDMGIRLRDISSRAMEAIHLSSKGTVMGLRRAGLTVEEATAGATAAGMDSSPSEKQVAEEWEWLVERHWGLALA